MVTDKDSQSCFSLHSTSGQKNFIQSLLAIIVKRQLLQVKNCFRLLKLYFSLPLQIKVKVEIYIAV